MPLRHYPFRVRLGLEHSGVLLQSQHRFGLERVRRRHVRYADASADSRVVEPKAACSTSDIFHVHRCSKTNMDYEGGNAKGGGEGSKEQVR